MKIALLTLPLVDNYGGHLQIWALQRVLTQLGHDVVVLNLQSSDKKGYRTLLGLKKIAAALIRLLPNKKAFHYIDYRSLKEKNFSIFRKHYISLTKEIYNSRGLKKVFHDEKCDAIIVGSDQVWRKWKFVNLDYFFLSWLDVDVPKLGYAISYGKEDLELTKEEILKYSFLAKNFQALSMREKNGVALTEKHFGINSELVLDPTLLLDEVDYVKFIGNAYKNYSGSLFYYVLDQTEEKGMIVRECSNCLGLSPLEVMPKKRWFDPYENHPENDYIYPSVEEWLSAFYYSDFVVTDSYHGTVFSIIFRKPFLVIGNVSRGLSRIHSILEIFGLQNRLLLKYDLDTINDIAHSTIDWFSINQQKDKWRVKSISFLKEHLDSK